MADNNKPLTEQEIVKWSRESYQKATAFLAEKGIIAETVSMEQSRYLAPLVAIWKIKTTDSKWFWVISGDLPADMMAEEGAQSPREALKAFSFKWQLDSEKITTGQVKVAQPEQFASFLNSRAESLYELSESEDLWGKA